MIYTLNSGPKTVGVCNNNKWYVLGFKSLHNARRVHYNIGTDPTLSLVRKRSSPDNQGLLNISKGKCTGYHMITLTPKEFYTFPTSKNVGVIMAYDLLKDTPEDFTFRVHIVEPYFDMEVFRAGLTL